MITVKAYWQVSNCLSCNSMRIIGVPLIGKYFS